MAIKTPTGSNNTKPVVIRFSENSYRLTWESLKKQMPAPLQKMDDWRAATLKFISFDHGELHLLNTSEKQSYRLGMQVQDRQLIATCNCGHKSAGCCDHIYGALRTIIWEFGEQYFENLEPDGLMELSFQDSRYFDKKETKGGLNVSVRPELESVFKLNDRVTKYDLPALLRLPTFHVIPSKKLTSNSRKYAGEEAIGYLLIFPFKNRFLPFVIPNAGKLNKAKSGIKLFYEYLSGAKKQYDHLAMEGQKELNTACFNLWKHAEKLSGFLFTDNGLKVTVQKRLSVFTAWQQMIVNLAQENLIYGYGLYRIEELKKGRPLKQRILPVTIGSERPEIRFILADCSSFCQLTLQVLIDGKEIQDYSTEIPFFILLNRTLYMLSSLKDAAIVQWMQHLEGQITVFKVHFAEFEMDILNPIRQYYTVKEVRKPKSEIPLQL